MPFAARLTMRAIFVAPIKASIEAKTIRMEASEFSFSRT
jgi:hypothetical protein